MSASDDFRAAVDGRQRLVLVTGPSGAGRSTAINVLEDLGYEVIDNLPLSMLPRLLEGPQHKRPLALGIDVRNRDFSITGLTELVDDLMRQSRFATQLLYLDASPEVLVRRYSETRRRHPLAPAESATDGITREIDLLIPIRARADLLIDTSEMTPHQLRAEIELWFAEDDGADMAISVQSFSYKRGMPRGVDMAFDVRFLNNPYWEPSLRSLSGQDAEVRAYVAADARYEEFFAKVLDLTLLLLPAYQQEGKRHLTIAFGCTGGQHRSVTLAENLSKALADRDWAVSIRHRELERRAHGGPKLNAESTA